MVNELRKCTIHFDEFDLPPINFGFSELSSEVKKQVFNSAKLYRKLKFIEEFFNTTFNLPNEISWLEVAQVEMLFCGITEGEFSTPAGNSVTIFNYRLTKDDLENISVPRKKKFSFTFTEDLLVLDKFFSVGKIIFELKKSSIANPRILKNYTIGEIVPNLRLNVFDYQVNHRFEKYLNKERLIKNKKKLRQFKAALKEKEPQFLINLLNESLIEINRKSAVEIIEGLLQYHDFPDRFAVLKPELQNDRWKISIALTYPEHEPILLTDAFVDVRTGKVEMEMSFDELLKKGRKKAKEAFSIA